MKFLAFLLLTLVSHSAFASVSYSNVPNAYFHEYTHLMNESAKEEVLAKCRTEIESIKAKFGTLGYVVLKEVQCVRKESMLGQNGETSEVDGSVYFLK